MPRADTGCSRRIGAGIIWVGAIYNYWDLISLKAESLLKDWEEKEGKTKGKEEERVDGKSQDGSQEENGRTEGERTEDKAKEENKDEEEDDGLVPAEQPEGSWFIPLGWARARPRVLYTTSDPEWKMYRLTVENPAKLRSIQRKCLNIQICRFGLARH